MSASSGATRRVNMAATLCAADRLGNARKPVAAHQPEQAAIDGAGDARAFVDHRRIELDQAGAGADALPGVLGGTDPAHPDQRNRPATGLAEIAQPKQREIAQ